LQDAEIYTIYSMKLRVTSLLSVFAILVGCVEEAPPRSVQDFLADPIALEAALVTCLADRVESRYEPECVNARQASSMIAAREERERRARAEAESERKRAALRRTQAAAAEARRRAVEAERRRKEAEYLAQFGELPPREDEMESDEANMINAPTAIIPPAAEEQNLQPSNTALPPTGSNAPVAEQEAEESPNLEAIREELRRRNEGTEN
jgi:hypothetical protein